MEKRIEQKGRNRVTKQKGLRESKKERTAYGEKDRTEREK